MNNTIFEERIAGVPFRYDETTNELTIGIESVDSKPIVLKIEDFDELRNFIDKIEQVRE